MGISVTAFNAMDSVADPAAKALKGRANSDTKDFPTLPYGILK